MGITEFLFGNREELAAQETGRRLKLIKNPGHRQQAQIDQAEKISRRLFLRKASLATGSALIAAGSIAEIAIQILAHQPDEPANPLETYTGDVNQTQSLILQWDSEVGADLTKFINYAPRISNLATSYFSNQMSSEFPDLADRYQVDELRGRFRFYSPSAYQRAAGCGQQINVYDLASTDPYTRVISTSPEKFFNGIRLKKDASLTWFLMSVHELFHSTAARKPALGSYIAEGTTKLRGEPIGFIQGLKLFVRDPKNPGDKCPTSRWWELEETVVEHATNQLVKKVGISNTESVYLPWVASYQDQIISPLFKGRYQDLLKLQQNSDFDGFLATIGGRLMGENAPFENAIGAATQLIVPLLDVKMLNRRG